MNKILLTSAIAFFYVAVPLVADTVYSYDQLQESYIQNSATVQSLEIKTRKAHIEQQKTHVQNGAAVTLSSGSVSADFGEATTVLAAPSATLSLPSANSTTVTAKMPLTVISEEGETTSYIGTKSDGAGVSAKTGIITAAPEERKITLLQSERTVLEACRSEYDGHLTAEKEFATQVSTLLGYISKILDARDDQLEYETSFLQIKVQGYLPTAPKYRSAQLKALSANRTAQEALHTFNREYVLFMEKCGFSDCEGARDIRSVFELLPVSVPDVALISFDSFPAETFAEIESSEWTHYIKTRTREADRPFSLFGSAGWEYTELSPSGKEESCHFVTAGLETTYKGITAGADLAVPIVGEGNPGVTFTFGWAPATGKAYNLTKESGAMDAQLETLDIRNAQDSYRTTRLSRNQKRLDLLWSKSQYEEELAVYTQLLDDAKKGYENGLVTTADYQQAENDYYKSYITELTGRLDRIVYNVETSVLFTAFESNGDIK